MKNKIITIITVCLNSSSTIKNTLNSLLNQNFTEFEYIVIEGNSNDGTLNILSDYKLKFKKKKISYRVISENDNGIYDAFNKGIKLARGEFIGILNSDDFYEENILEVVIKNIINNKNVDIFYGFLRLIMDDGLELQTYRYRYENFLANFNSRIFSAAQHPSCFISKKLYNNIGLYDLQYESASDYDFLLRAKLSGAKFFPIDKIITNFRLGGYSNTIEDHKKSYQRLMIHYKNGLIDSSELNKNLKNIRVSRFRSMIIKFIRRLNTK